MRTMKGNGGGQQCRASALFLPRTILTAAIVMWGVQLVAANVAEAAGASDAAKTVGPDWIVSANDGKYQRVDGADSYLPSPPPDTLTLLDATTFPPKIVKTVVVENGIQGPPQAVAVTPDGALALVAAPTRYDGTTKRLLMDTFLQVVPLTGPAAGSVQKRDLGSHPQAIAIDPTGTMALVTCVDGTVHVMRIARSDSDAGVTVDVSETATLKLSDKRLAGISFTHDGQQALVALRDQQGVAVLNIVDGRVTDSGDRLSTGVAPYTIDVSSDGKWAVVSNAGLAGLADVHGRLAGDADTVTLIDVSHSPFRATQQLSVPSVPEGVAISPNGKWIVVQAMDGSNLVVGNPGRRAHGKIVLFEIRNGQAVQVSEAIGGEAAQGIVFARDNRHVIVQFNVERELALYALHGDRIVDTGQRMPLAAGPTSIRTTPR